MGASLLALAKSIYYSVFTPANNLNLNLLNLLLYSILTHQTN